MKFNNSKDGIERASIRLHPVRLSREEVNQLRDYLRRENKSKGTDADVRRFVNLCTETDLDFYMGHDDQGDES